MSKKAKQTGKEFGEKLRKASMEKIKKNFKKRVESLGKKK